MKQFVQPDNSFSAFMKTRAGKACVYALVAAFALFALIMYSFMKPKKPLSPEDAEEGNHRDSSGPVLISGQVYIL